MIVALHPLQPLSAEGFRRTAELLRRDGGITASYRFASVTLAQPPKADVLARRPGDPVRRAAFAVVWSRADNQTYEATVDLTADRVLSFRAVPGVCPNFTVDEYHEVDQAMRAHPAVIAALARRGITDMSLVLSST
jgi:primary-amine oxidase